MPTDTAILPERHERASSSEEARFVVPMVSSIVDADAVARSHERQLEALADRLRRVEKQLDTHGSPWWKRILFRADGWPAWWVVARKPDWRPWRRWWTS